jgi:hypothetical protein
VSGSVIGAGATRRFSAVRWGVARRIVWAWIFTIPASATLAAIAALLVKAGPVAVTLAILVVGAVGLSLLVRQRRRKRPSGDYAMGPMDGLSPAKGSASLNATAERASAVRTVKSR